MSTSSIIDIPKKAGDKDQLGIDAYKNGLTNFIDSAQTPLTIAIQGEWGSGKTSLMNAIRHDLCESNSKFHGIWINTWEYSLLTDEYTTMTNIIQGIIASVISELSKDKNQNLEALKSKAVNFFKAATRGATKFGANALTAGVAGDATDAFFESTEKQSSLHDLHAELQEQINISVEKSNGIKGFLFFIDDLDRINPPVAVQILELLKNIFDLENCIFLLAIDYEVVVKGLEPKFGKKTTENEREFRSFFEKIIQLPFTMPIGQYRVNDLIIDNLTKLQYFNTGELTPEISDVIVDISNLTVGSNPRAIKRLLNSLSLVRSIMLAVENESKPTAFEQLINIGVFSIQIAYPLLFRVLERYPDFTAWNDEVIETFKLKAIDADLKDKLSKNEYFDEEWEQVLYQLCQRENFLSNRAMQISRLFNTLKIRIECNASNETNDSQDVTLLDVMTNAIQIASVTSYDTNSEEQKVKEIHKSGFLKGLRDRIYLKLINQAKAKNIEILYEQKAVRSNLTFLIKKGVHKYRFDISIGSGSKEYTLLARYECWYYVKAIHNDFNRNLEEPDAKAIKAKDRFDQMIIKMEHLSNKLPDNYKINHRVLTNDKHNTVAAAIAVTTPNAWAFIKDEDSLQMFLDNLINLLEVVEDIKIVGI
ncbi:P-loop NTPase fold protein [Lacinutrix sp. 5H-3-7-4]|uniref:KAP family P-loop NTPase fold protein n=1 Tax=Lacinutrix sp. (strain 5H-3-7-4) TaxID=983544 RepID=UPI00020A3C1D|nr:P-loop NTPase fold protein [Lacinutrix sp. 5H-3-7-4]AEH01979.1 KAP P-loop domain protein [Lacinutrix sp. 5H-3-7-4]